MIAVYASQPSSPATTQHSLEGGSLRGQDGAIVVVGRAWRLSVAEPDRLWGTDASMVQTVADGRVWVFAALDHSSEPRIVFWISSRLRSSLAGTALARMIRSARSRVVSGCAALRSSS